MKNHLLNRFSIMFLSIIAILIPACTYKPEPFNPGTDVCAHCKMTIIDPKWGAEIITKTGKVLKFDVVECMVSYKIDNFHDSSKIQSIWTINYANPGEFINAKDAIYARSNEFNSPMGLNAVSVKTKQDLDKIKFEQKPEIISWYELKNLIKLEFYGNKLLNCFY